MSNSEKFAKLMGVLSHIINALYEKGLDLPREFNVTGFWNRTGAHYMEDQDSLPEWKIQDFLIQEGALLGFLRGIRFSSALEIGCGYGRILRLLSNNFDAELAGLDLSRDQLVKAARLLDGRVQLYEGRGEHLRFPDRSFDLVLTCNVLLHVPPRRLVKVLREMLRVARFHVVLVEPCKDDPGGIRKSYCWAHDYGTKLARIGVVSVQQHRILLSDGYNRIIHVKKPDA